MYDVDGLDAVIEIDDAPQSSVGAPNPFVMSDEHQLVLAYYVEERDQTAPPRLSVDAAIQGDSIALVQFDRYATYMFGPPNDEAFAGHPLAPRGLHPYAVFRIQHSSWIRSLARMNSIHPNHDPSRYESLQHFIFAFHDSTFECVARGFSTSVRRGSIRSMIPEMRKYLEADDV